MDTVTQTTTPGSSVFTPAIIVDDVEAHDNHPALWSVEIRRTVRAHVLRSVLLFKSVQPGELG